MEASLPSPPHEQYSFLPTLSIPFVWEDQPGLSKPLHSHAELPIYPLPLPPRLHANPSSPRSPLQRSLSSKLRDFFTTLSLPHNPNPDVSTCESADDEIADPGHRDLSSTEWSSSSSASTPRRLSSINHFSHRLLKRSQSLTEWIRSSPLSPTRVPSCSSPWRKYGSTSDFTMSPQLRQLLDRKFPHACKPSRFSVDFVSTHSASLFSRSFSKKIRPINIS